MEAGAELGVGRLFGIPVEGIPGFQEKSERGGLTSCPLWAARCSWSLLQVLAGRAQGALRSAGRAQGALRSAPSDRERKRRWSTVPGLGRRTSVMCCLRDTARLLH